MRLAAESDRTCAVRSDGSLWCWGREVVGRTEPAGFMKDHPPWIDERIVPRPAAIDGWSRLKSIALALDHDCAVIEGVGFCQGANTRFQLGDGTSAPRTLPVAVVGLGHVDEIGAGYEYSCARSEGHVWCWGSNTRGQCGDDEREVVPTPTQVPGLRGARALSLGHNHACALLDNDTAHCWGDNQFGQLGSKTATSRSNPIPVPITGVRALTAIHNHTAAILADGTALGWGLNEPRHLLWSSCSAPQVGTLYADANRRREPIGSLKFCGAPSPLPGLVNVAQIVLGTDHVCALLQNGQIWCWGTESYNIFGGPVPWGGSTPVRIEFSRD